MYKYISLDVYMLDGTFSTLFSFRFISLEVVRNLKQLKDQTWIILPGDKVMILHTNKHTTTVNKGLDGSPISKQGFLSSSSCLCVRQAKKIIKERVGFSFVILTKRRSSSMILILAVPSINKWVFDTYFQISKATYGVAGATYLHNVKVNWPLVCGDQYGWHVQRLQFVFSRPGHQWPETRRQSNWLRSIRDNTHTMQTELR